MSSKTFEYQVVSPCLNIACYKVFFSHKLYCTYIKNESSNYYSVSSLFPVSCSAFTFPLGGHGGIPDSNRWRPEGAGH